MQPVSAGPTQFFRCDGASCGYLQLTQALHNVSCVPKLCVAVVTWPKLDRIPRSGCCISHRATLGLLSYPPIEPLVNLHRRQAAWTTRCSRPSQSRDVKCDLWHLMSFAISGNNVSRGFAGSTRFLLLVDTASWAIFSSECHSILSLQPICLENTFGCALLHPLALVSSSARVQA